MSKQRRRLVEFTIGVAPPDHAKLLEVAKQYDINRREVVRIAISQYLQNLNKAPQEEKDNILEQRLRKLENRLANLVVLSTRAAAQNLYFMTLPFTRGGWPKRPLKEEAFNKQWAKSRYFASSFLKNALIDPPKQSADKKDEKQS